jgi:hypothetical protein
MRKYLVRHSPRLCIEIIIILLGHHFLSHLYNHAVKIIINNELKSSRLESYVTTDGHSASMSSNKAPIWGLRQDFYYCQTVAGLLAWGALSDKRMGLSFTIAAGPRQRSLCRVRVQWDS